jgi:NADP-dependent 3-hydroxy acid dehydrogenase YdfG
MMPRLQGKVALITGGSSGLQSSFDHVLEQGAPHLEVVSHVDSTDFHGFLLHV